MAFSEIELKKIDKFVGGLCRKRTPERFRNELKFEYRIKGHDVEMVEIRPFWNDPAELMELSVAKLKFNRAKNIWVLFWKRASGKWQRYEPSKATNDLAELVAEIDRDEFGCFFG